MFAVLALLLLRLPLGYREAIARGVRLTVLRPVLALQESAAERDTRLADPARLRAERDSLAAFLVGQATLAAENRQLRELLGIRGRLPFSFVSAELTRMSGRGAQGTFLLTVGSRNGIRPGAPIVSAAGLVGKVRDVDAGSAIGIDWTHHDFRASAMTLDGETYGIVEPRGGEVGEPMLVLTGAAFHADLQPGTTIVTSGLGGVYPRGIPIGEIVKPPEGGGEDSEWRRTYWVRPFVGPAEMNHILVMGDRVPDTEERDLAALWGIRAPDLPPIDSLGRPVIPFAPAVAPAPPRTPGPAGRPSGEGPRLLGQPARPGPEPQAEPAQPEPEDGPRLLGRPVRPRPSTGDTAPRREER